MHERPSILDKPVIFFLDETGKKTYAPLRSEIYAKGWDNEEQRLLLQAKITLEKELSPQRRTQIVGYAEFSRPIKGVLYYGRKIRVSEI